MTKLKNDTLIRALLRQPTEYTPVWLMRQAGRYLPEYNQTRSRAGSFLGLCKNPAYATEVTLQPLARFELDAAILFSDILTIPDAMGLGLYFAEGEGPKFERPLRDEWAIRDLAVPDPGAELRYVIDAVGEIRRALDGSVPLIGFAGSPYTLACYMVEGGASDDFRTIKTMLYARPELLHRILEVNATGRDALPQRPDRGRRAGRDDFRYLGRKPVACGLSRVLARLHAAHRRRPRHASMPARAFRPSYSPRAAATGWKTSPPSAAMRSAWTGASTSVKRERASVTGLRCRATSIPPCYFLPQT